MVVLWYSEYVFQPHTFVQLVHREEGRNLMWLPQTGRLQPSRTPLDAKPVLRRAHERNNAPHQTTPRTGVEAATPNTTHGVGIIVGRHGRVFCLFVIWLLRCFSGLNVGGRQDVGSTEEGGESMLVGNTTAGGRV